MSSSAADFVRWETKRTDWRDLVHVTGDEGYAAQVLDAMNIV